ncbi:MAG: hypothetical protein K6G37_03205 [Bacilli bacterium]|nr:hypothetical protein [Bacilli bacterium]
MATAKKATTKKPAAKKTTTKKVTPKKSALSVEDKKTIWGIVTAIVVGLLVFGFYYLA